MAERAAATAAVQGVGMWYIPTQAQELAAEAAERAEREQAEIPWL